jgi:nicotinate-nucleotide pyrophosphorylase (carboxylating)
MGLHDQAMIKDTHLAVCGSITEAVRRVLARGHDPAVVTVEVRDAVQLRDAMEAGAGRALLDNMDLPTLRDCVRLGKGKIVLEASGGLHPGNLAEVAGTGVDFLSLGFLTHSAPAADLAMEMDLADS